MITDAQVGGLALHKSELATLCPFLPEIRLVVSVAPYIRSFNAFFLFEG